MSLILVFNPQAPPDAIDETMGFHNSAIFPELASYPSQGGPTFDTAIVRTDSEHETRTVRRGSMGRYRFEIRVALLTSDEAYAVRTFGINRRGSAFGFLFTDWLDWNSSPTGTSETYTDTSERVRIGTGDGTQTLFQLFKAYDDGVYSTPRKISRPKEGTVSIWVNGTAQVLGVDFTVDVDTGIVSFVTAPANGAVIHAAFEFYVPVRFDEDADAWFEVGARDYENNEYRLGLVEIPDRGEFAETTLQHGGFKFWPGTTTGVQQLRFSDGILHQIDGSSSPTMRLWSPASVPAGGPYTKIWHWGSSGTVTVTALDGSPVGTLAPGEWGEVFYTGFFWLFLKSA